MARREDDMAGGKVFGPYKHKRRWRIIVELRGGERHRESYETKEKASQVKRSLERLMYADGLTVGSAVNKYEKHQLEAKGNKPTTVNTTVHRLNSFFDLEMPMERLNTNVCERLYQDLRDRKTKQNRRTSVDTHRNTLAECKTFLNWCVKKKWLRKNPLAGVDGVGKRQHGKDQLYIDEARSWCAKAHKLAANGDEGAVAALVALLMGFRASEITQRVVRDLDDGGRVLWIPDAKTAAGRRRVEVPDELQPYLLRLVVGRGPSDWLFGYHDRNWPRKCVKRICRAAGVREVTAHGMRGAHASLAEESGVSSHAVTKSLGHESIKTTRRSYAKREAVAKGIQSRLLDVLGKPLSETESGELLHSEKFPRLESLA